MTVLGETIACPPEPVFATTLRDMNDPFAENEDQQALRTLARDVAIRDLAPMARHWDETEEFPEGSWEAIRKAGLFGITVDEKYGGHGFGDIEAAIVLEELGRVDVSSAILAQLTFNGPPRAIQHLGSEEMKERWLPMAASGEALFCIGISETEAGSAVTQMRARLTSDGNGYRLNGYKNYVTGGHRARVCLVWCRFPGSEGAKGIGAVLVDLESDGVTIAGTHVKMGLRGTSEAELAFDDVRIEPEDVLSVGDATSSETFKTLIAHINHERCGNAAMCVGAAQGSLEYAIGYMNERTIGGKPIAELQGLQWKIADMATQIEGARLLLLRAVHLAGPHGTPPHSKPLWPNQQPTSQPSLCATRQSSCLVVTGTRGNIPSSGPTETFVVCASEREQSKSSVISSAHRFFGAQFRLAPVGVSSERG